MGCTSGCTSGWTLGCFVLGCYCLDQVRTGLRSGGVGPAPLSLSVSLCPSPSLGNRRNAIPTGTLRHDLFTNSVPWDRGYFISTHEIKFLTKSELGDRSSNLSSVPKTVRDSSFLRLTPKTQWTSLITMSEPYAMFTSRGYQPAVNVELTETDVTYELLIGTTTISAGLKKIADSNK